jgi:hypothetical protein
MKCWHFTTIFYQTWRLKWAKLYIVYLFVWWCLPFMRNIETFWLVQVWIINTFEPHSMINTPNHAWSMINRRIWNMNCSMLDCSLLNNKLGVVPINWKRANIMAGFKKDDPSLSCNYRPISLLCVLSKVLERCVHSHSYYHLAPRFHEREINNNPTVRSVPWHSGACCKW